MTLPPSFLKFELLFESMVTEAFVDICGGRLV
jgi:hypothetical protein